LRDQRRTRAGFAATSGRDHERGERDDRAELAPVPDDRPHSAVYTIRMRLKDGLLVEFDHEIGTTRKLLERLPDDKLSWKPHEKSMSLGGLGTHLRHILNWAPITL